MPVNDPMAGLTDISLSQASVIGCMLIDDRCIPSILSQVHEEDFSDTYRSIFRAIDRLDGEGITVDPVTVLHELGDLPEYKSILFQCMEVTPSAANADHYARVLRQQNRLRRIREIGVQITGMTDLSDIRALLETAAELAVDTRVSRVFTMNEVLKEFADVHSGRVSYLSWPIEELTDELGTEAGDFVIVGGRPSTGKTALTIQCAYHWARTMKVGYFSLETNRRKVTDRLVSHAARINKARIRRNQMTEEDWNVFALKSSNQISRAKLELIEAAGMTVADIQAYTVMRGYDIIIVDYLQLITEQARSPYEAATAISKKLHVLAQNKRVTVVALSQLSRMDKSNPRYATMSDLRESGQIEQDADIILMLNPKNPKEPVQGQNRLLRVEKNKEGECSQIELEFEGHFQTFKKAPVTLDEHMAQRGTAAPRYTPQTPHPATAYEQMGY